MLKKLKLRMARRELNLALQQEEHYLTQARYLREIVVPKIRQRIDAAELDVLGEDCQSALANPCTPAHQSRRLAELLMQQEPGRRC